MSADFNRINRLPPYILGEVVALMTKARRHGDDIIDLGMGNPDIPTPKPIVDKLKEAAEVPKNHRYSISRGIPGLRKAICDWYQRRYEVDLDPESEAIVTIGAKEGIAHLVLATVESKETVLVPNPTYPIHAYSVVIAGGDVRSIPFTGEESDFFDEMVKALKLTWPKPKMLILNFPHNPTTAVVDLDFFKKIVEFALENKLYVIHDLAYGDLCFDGYEAPSFLEVPRAKEVGVEFYSMSKGFSMPGWRVGFCVGNREMIHALGRIKSYLDYGVFQPVQIASAVALNQFEDVVCETRDIYCKRRNALVEGLNKIGWKIKKPKATMFVWAKIPEDYMSMGSLEFSKFLLKVGKVAVSPGAGFGEFGEGYVRFALIENEHRIKQAVRGIKKALFKGK
jgi:alanine-synthesizing transaminase